MNFVKLSFNSANGRYSYTEASSEEMSDLGLFLTDGTGCDKKTLITWALYEDGDMCGSNATRIEKPGDGCIYLSSEYSAEGYISLDDYYSEDKTPKKLKLSIAQFVQLLDDWKEKVCVPKPKEVMIKYENGQFIIETGMQ